MNKGKLITVSFHLPYRLAVSQSRLSLSPGIDGPATALRSFFAGGAGGFYGEFHWMGASDISRQAFDRLTNETAVTAGNIIMHPFFLPDDETKDEYENGFCDSVIWPLFLNQPSFAEYRTDHFDAYVCANERMSEAISRIYQPGDTIWIHDYHWMLLPGLLRAEFPDARIGFFMHIPFPSYELYRMLPEAWGKQLIDGMMGANVIGFQTDEFGHHFLESMNQLMPPVSSGDRSLTTDERPILIKCSPMSIDYKKYYEASLRPDTAGRVKRIRERVRAEKLVLSIDRLDCTRAVFNPLESFDLFLEQNPAFREKVTYVLILVSSGGPMISGGGNKADLVTQIARINEKYSTNGWTPVICHYEAVDFLTKVALYGAADVAVVASSRDGMNLAAKEFVACKTMTDGVLLLSETAGAADELEEALLVNPNDKQELADCIAKSLAMPLLQQRSRMKDMQTRIASNDVFEWSSDFLRAIDQVIETADADL